MNRVRAELRETLWGVGATLYEVERAAPPDLGPRVVTVNGAEVTIRSGLLDEPLQQVLDRAERRCGGSSAIADTVVRDQDQDAGFVACFEGAAALDPRAFLRASRAALGDGDLGAFGPFLYTYARDTGEGTHLVEASIPGLDLAAMFPAEGDAPGADVPGVPRPEGARRALAAAPHDDAHHIAVYRVPGATLEVLERFYRDGLAAAGWQVQPVAADDDRRRVLYGLRGTALAAVVLRRESREVVVTVAAGL
jgi:hypothetical protein